MRHTLSVDIETFSETDIGKCGSFRYIEDPAFEILLLAYAYDGDPVQVLDLACGDTVPEELLRDLYDPEVIKTGWNNAFERYAFQKHFGRYCPPEQWEDSMVLAAQCGLPASLDNAGKALGLGEDAAKMKEGKALIRYFCLPCKPTKSNGGRTRNLPGDAPERWETFKRYNGQDVVVERNIRNLLLKWKPNDREHRFWCLDARINEKGVRIDKQLAVNAVAMDRRYKEELTARAMEITGLENPKSVSQVKNWLMDQEGKEFPSLNKKVIADVVSQLQTDRAREFMALRTELSKSSTAKYEAMLRSMCQDDHCKGCFLFYGANRTGRFCLTGDHEVLTPTGWVPLERWHGGRIAVWNPSLRALSFQESRSVSFPYEGDLLAISHQRCEQLSTPEHKMPILSKTGQWEGKELRDVFGHTFSIAFTGTREIATPRDHDALRVLIMVQADGHFTAEGDLKLGFKKLRKVERCKHLLRKAEIPFVLRELKNRVQQFTIRRQDQPMWLRGFRNKTFDWWLLDEDSRVVVEELEHWDSYRCGPNSIQYVTTNKQNAEVLQAVCALGGYSATLLVKARGTDTPNWNDAYVLNIWLTPGDSTTVRPSQQSTIHFSGSVYCAITPTGYFLTRRNGKCWITGNSGKLVQFQNMSKNEMPDLDQCRELVRRGKYTALKALYDGVSGPLSELVRTAIIPEDGCKIMVADFSAIEARVIAWIAGEQWRLEVFRKGGDIYCASASQMFKVPVVKHGENGHLRQKGKIAELALGYGGGINALKAFGADKMGMTEEEMQETVDLWRESSPKICELWRALEKAAIRSVARRGTVVSTMGGIRFDFEDGILWMTLPSGRRIAYYGARYEESRLHPGRKVLSYMGVNQQNKRWERVETWGGKLVENCWAAGTPVLTTRGWVGIETVTSEDLIWDGEAWVRNDGSECQYRDEVLFELDGLLVTGDHKILTAEGWKNAKECDGLDRLPVQLPGDYRAEFREGQPRAGQMAGKMHLRKGQADGHSGSAKVGEKGAPNFLRLHEAEADRAGKYDPRNDLPHGLRGLAFYGTTLHRALSPRMEKLRRAWHHSLRPLAAQLQEFLGRHGLHLRAGLRAGLGPERQQRRILPGELPLGNADGQLPKQAECPLCNLPGAGNAGQRIGGEVRDWVYDAAVPAEPRLSARQTDRRAGPGEPVYDVKNCGPRHRYVVMGKHGPIIAHNCVQATARDCLRESMLALDDAGYDIRAHVHDEVIVSEPIGGRSVEEMADLMGQPIAWAPGLPLRADGYETPFYKKD